MCRFCFIGIIINITIHKIIGFVTLELLLTESSPTVKPSVVKDDGDDDTDYDSESSGFGNLFED